MASPNSKLFKPLRIGPIQLSFRIVMGPVCSVLADSNKVIGPGAIDYYGSRANVPGTLIIGEASFISPQASGTPEPRAGIFSQEQIAAWKAVVDEVHRQGSFMYLQLWALGRSADPECKKRDGMGDVVSSSAVPEEGGAVPRALTEEEIWEYVRDYGTAARVAVEEAGFDGVELHGGNGSLIDQFTQDVVNQRTDQWGGSIENRSRFGLEITKAVCEAVGSDRVGFRITPWSTYNSMGMKGAVEQFTDLVRGLKELKLAYLHLVESRIAGRVDVEQGESLEPFIKTWSNTSPLMLAGGFSPESAQEAVDSTYRDKDVGIVFGRAFVTNPDLVKRLRDGIELVDY